METQPRSLNCNDVVYALNSKYGNAHYLVNNVYFFGGGYGETDLLVVQKSGLIFDVEIKVSRSDFFADFKKVEKHNILSGNTEALYLPNKFYYAVPDGLIKPDEVPAYAGLIYIKGAHATEAKPALMLHKEKLEFRKRLSDKFYYCYRELISYKERDKIADYKKEISNLNKALELSRKEQRETYYELIKLQRHGN